MLEEKDPQYDAMLSQMVGRIQTKPGGKSEMGEVSSFKLLGSCNICCRGYCSPVTNLVFTEII